MTEHEGGAPTAPGRRGGVDLLAPDGESAGGPGVAQRIRSSRFGSLIVLALTVAVVAAGVWLVRAQGAQDAAARTAGATVIRLAGASATPPEVGKPAQDLALTSYDGTAFTLGGLRGQVVWLTFGASWCTGCQAEVPDIQATHEAFAARGVAVVGVNIGEDAAAVKAYAQRVGLTYRIAPDPDQAAAEAYAVSAVPAHFFLDRSGVIRDIRVGSLSPETMRTILEKLAAS